MSLSLHGLRKRYPTLDLDLDLDVADGELATLLGPSGCGKTTALRLIAGFLQPDAGSVIIDGRDVSALAPEERGVGIVFQDYALFPHMDVAANVAFGPRMRGWPRREIDGRVEELLALVGLAGYGRRKVDELSGGEQQRVALARALAPRPRLLLLDEPLSALDRGLRESLRREIRRVQRGLGITAIYVTHDQEEALALSDRVIVINGGRVAQAGGPREVYARPASLFVAGFVGKSNRVAGTIASRSACELEVTTAWGPFRCLGPPAGRVGDAVSVLFRPEGCRIAAAGVHPPQNSLVAVVDSVEYVGEGSLVRARADGCELLVKTGDGAPPAPGDRVTLVAAPSACWALPGAPDT